MPLNKLQKEAVEYLEGPLLVLAGPGTGKTQLLSSKVEYILKETDANPENILCLTFTESGAENMRDRLYSMIGKASSKVNIHTYHAFGSDILAAYKNYATEFSRNLDSPIDSITTYKIINKIQEDLDGKDILKSSNISDIIDTIASAKSARLTANDLEAITRDNIEVSEKLNPELSIILNKLVPRMKFDDAIEKVYGRILETLAKYVKKDPIAKHIEREANGYLFELNQIIEEEKTKEKPSVSPLTKWKTSRFEKDDDGNYRLSNIVSNKKLLSLSNIMRKYDEYLTSEGLFDFSDMIEEAIDILKTDNGFRATMSERFQYILLDEFQDTNPSQAELIYLLTEYDQPIIMAVGDDDQAIFEFQGANSSNFIDYQNHYNAKVITLKENYRSTSEILTFSRKIADQLESSFAKTNNIDKNLIAAGEITKKAKPEISRHEFISADAEYYWVADQISNLVKSGVPQKDIAIIAPKHKYIIPLLPYLKNHEKIYVAYEKRDNLFEDQKISELLTLATFIHQISENEKPDHKILEILSFPFWKLPPSTIIKGIKPDKEKSALELLLDSNDEKIKQIGFLLSTLVTKAYDTPLELFFDYLAGNAVIPTLHPETAENIQIKSPFIDFYSKIENPDYTTFSLYENLTVLKSAIVNHTRNDNPKLKDLIEFIHDYETANAPLMNSSPYQDSENAVQILTVHKSKGLEFKYVFLIAMDNLSWGKSKGNNNLLTLPTNLTSIRHTGITNDEKLRLLFVAITRAKSNLIITNSISDFSGKNPTRLEYLEEHEEDGTLISPLIGTRIITHYDDLEEAKKATDIRLSWISAYKTLDTDLKPVLIKRLENYKLTASDLTTFIDIIYSGPTEFYKNKVLLSPREPLTKSTALGNLIHQSFEMVTSKNITDHEAIDLFRENATKVPLELTDKKYLLDVGPNILETSLNTFSEILRAKDSFAEVNLHSEHLIYDKVPLTGKIDHINIDKTNKTIEIYDFKTSSHHPPVRWDSQATPFKYKLQLCFYKLLLNLSPTYQNYKVTRGHILYVKPDDYNKVYDEAYDYPPEDKELLKALIHSIYAHIKTLDFVDDPEIFVTPDENRKLKDIKDFIDLIIEKTPR